MKINICTILKKSLFILEGVLLALLVFLTLFSISAKFSFMNSNYHQKLFQKHNIYSYTYDSINSVIDSAYNEISQNFEADSFECNLLKTLKSSISFKFVVLNIDLTRDGLFQYFNGEKEFLPDISFSSIENIQEIGKLTQDITPTTLTTLNKVNLSTLLLTFNYDSILNIFLILKFVFFILKLLPSACILLFLFICLITLIFSKKADSLHYISKHFFISLELLCLIYILFLISVPYIFSPDTWSSSNFYSYSFSLLINYFKDLSLPLIIFFTFLCFSFMFIKRLLPRIFPLIRNFFSSNSINSSYNPNYSKTLYCILCCIVVLSINYKINLFKLNLKSNNFDTVISKIQFYNQDKEVISAKDNTFYAVQVIILDSKTKLPVPNIYASITGQAFDGTIFNEISKSDENGNILFNVSDGHFYLDFVSDLFPSEYRLPSRTTIDFDAAKTIVVPINLRSIPVISPEDQHGIIQVEVLDENNIPYPNLEFSMTSKYYPSEKLYSCTNANGLAVFRNRTGLYTIEISKGKFPSNQYYLPNNFDVHLENNTTFKYSIKLVKNN